MRHLKTEICILLDAIHSVIAVTNLSTVSYLELILFIRVSRSSKSENCTVRYDKVHLGRTRLTGFRLEIKLFSATRLAMLENVALQVAEVWCYTTTRSQQLAVFLAGYVRLGLLRTGFGARDSRSACMRPY